VLLNDGRIAMSGAPNDVMKADLLEAIYGWPVVVTRDPAVGAPALVPLRRPLTL
jgi:iron complex transport system ATP-binding protein